MRVLFDQVRKLTARGVAIIYITHKMDEIFEIGDEATILRDGKTVSSHHVEDLTKQEIIAKMVGREITSVYPPRTSMGVYGYARISTREQHEARQCIALEERQRKSPVGNRKRAFERNYFRKLWIRYTKLYAYLV